jgi:hypothetical protein
MAKIKLEFLHADKKFKVGVIHYKGEKDEYEIFNQSNVSSKLRNGSVYKKREKEVTQKKRLRIGMFWRQI